MLASRSPVLIIPRAASHTGAFRPVGCMCAFPLDQRVEGAGGNSSRSTQSLEAVLVKFAGLGMGIISPLAYTQAMTKP